MDTLLEPISEDAPCGVDLAYDTVTSELAVLIEGTPENQFEAGSAKEPNWPEFLKLSEETLGRSKDLQVAVYFAVALTKTSGMAGAARGLEVIAGFARMYWETVFPLIDPEDKDPTQRLNILSQLTVEQGSFGDPVKFIDRLHSAPIFRVPGLVVTLGYLTQEVAPGEGTGAAKLPEIIADNDAETVQAGIDALRRAVAAVHSLDDYLIETVGRDNSPSFDRLIKALDKGMRIFDNAATASTTSATDDETDLSDLGSDTDDGESAAPTRRARASKGGGGISGEINSPDDVRAMLAKIRDYYEANEPSSPVPFLLKRVERLLGKNFMELLLNLTPSARSEFEALIGPEEEES